MAKRVKRHFQVYPQEDLVTSREPGEMLAVDVLDTVKGLTAFASPYPHSLIGNSTWRGNKSAKSKWESLIREALIMSSDAGAVRLEINIARMPHWFEEMLKQSGFRLGESNLGTSWAMVANLR